MLKWLGVHELAPDVVFDAIPSDVVRETHVAVPCLFPELQGELLNTEDDVRTRPEEVMAQHPHCPVKVGVSYNPVYRMKSSDYSSWAGVCHVVAAGVQDNKHASQLESRGIVTAIAHAGTVAINQNSVGDDSKPGVPISYSPNFTARIYVAVDIRPCSLGSSRDDWLAMNPTHHMRKKDPNWVRKQSKQQDPTVQKTQDPTERKQQDPTE